MSSIKTSKNSPHLLFWLYGVCMVLDAQHKGYSTPPAWASKPKHLRSYILGRIGRLHELSISPTQSMRHILQLMADMCVCGWGRRDFRYLIHTLSCKPACPEINILKVILRFIEWSERSNSNFLVVFVCLAVPHPPKGYLPRRPNAAKTEWFYLW